LTPEEDTKLINAVKTTGKKKYGEEYRTDWVAIAVMVPGRRKQHCMDRWYNILHPKSDEVTSRVGKKWTTDEGSTLTDAVKKHNCNDWAAISELVPGRTKQQCKGRWHYFLQFKSDEMTARAGKWTTDEDSTLADAEENLNGADWAAISSLVPGSTNAQCKNRWHVALDSKSDETTAHKGKWTPDEDITLTDAVKKHNGKDWAAISELVSGRTKIQFHGRWNNSLYSMFSHWNLKL
jgi:hypothetical protein